jgi:hypothetical protein
MPTIAIETHEQLALELDLRVEKAPGNGAFRATIELSVIELVVVVIEDDLVGAVRAAAQQCSERLCERGYPVTVAQVLGALEFVEASKVPDALHSLIDSVRS